MNRASVLSSGRPLRLPPGHGPHCAYANHTQLSQVGKPVDLRRATALAVTRPAQTSSSRLLYM